MDGRGATVITGAGSGLGRALAIGFAASGHPVVLMGRRKEALLETAGMLGGEQTECLVVPVDVRFPDEVQEAADRTEERFGAVTTLINNAALLARGPQSVDEWTLFECIIRTNIKGPALVSESFVPLMTGGAVIVNISSPSSRVPTPFQLAYGASKAGLEQLTRSLAVRYAPRKIRVVGVAPGTLERREVGSERNLATAVKAVLFLANSFGADVHRGGQEVEDGVTVDLSGGWGPMLE